MLNKTAKITSLAFLFLLSACLENSDGGSWLSGGAESAEVTRSIQSLDPELPENQLDKKAAFGQIIITVENDDVIEELNRIKEIREAVQEIYFIRSNNSFQNVVYVVVLKKSLNPVPYYNFFQGFEGVVAAEFDGIIGLAEAQR